MISCRVSIGFSGRDGGRGPARRRWKRTEEYTGSAIAGGGKRRRDDPHVCFPAGRGNVSETEDRWRRVDEIFQAALDSDRNVDWVTSDSPIPRQKEEPL